MGKSMYGFSVPKMVKIIHYVEWYEWRQSFYISWQPLIKYYKNVVLRWQGNIFLYVVKVFLGYVCYEWSQCVKLCLLTFLKIKLWNTEWIYSSCNQEQNCTSCNSNVSAASIVVEESLWSGKTEAAGAQLGPRSEGSCQPSHGKYYQEPCFCILRLVYLSPLLSYPSFILWLVSL